MVLAVILGLIFVGLPKGVDFNGGILLEVRADQNTTLSDIRKGLSKVVQGDFSVQTLGGQNDYLLRLEANAFPEEGAEQIKERLQPLFGKGSQLRRFESIGPKVSSELLQKGLWAVFYALLAMMVYIWFRFEWRFGLAALIALLHDCVGVLGVYVLGRVEFNEAAIVAILITASYSINDTVVVFDRVRETRAKKIGHSFSDILNLSINETLSRTLLTSLTTLVALCALYFFGGPVIATFSLPILVGLLIGTYSSISVAGPLLLFLGGDALSKPASKKEV